MGWSVAVTLVALVSGCSLFVDEPDSIADEEPSNIPGTLADSGSAAWVVTTTVVLNTDDLELEIDGQLDETFPPEGVVVAHVDRVGTPGLAVIAATHIEIELGGLLVANGSRALVMASSGDIVLDGGIVATGGRTEFFGNFARRGAGGFNGGNANNSTPGDVDALGLDGSAGVTPEAGSFAGGGGGGHGGAGGAGGEGSGGAGGAGGGAHGSIELVPLAGGAGGGAGRGDGAIEPDDIARGGGGGGAVQLFARGRVRVAVTAGINCGGGGGEGGTEEGGLGVTGGGGGGAGGAILIEAQRIELVGGLGANGGGGGSGASANSKGANGTSGDLTAIGAPGGVGTGEGRDGAPGAAGSDAIDAAPGAGSSVGFGGGGGGAAGRIVLRSGTLGERSGVISPSHPDVFFDLDLAGDPH